MQDEGRYRNLIAILFIIEDIILLNLLYFGMLYVFSLKFDDVYNIALILINLGYMLSFALIHIDFNDAKQLRVLSLLRHNFSKLIITVMILIACMFFLKISGDASRLFTVVLFSTACLLMTATQYGIGKIMSFTIKHSINKGIILGSGVMAKKISDEMLNNVYNGVLITGVFDDNPGKNSIDVLGDIEQAKSHILKKGVTDVFCTLPLSEELKIKDFIKFSEDHVINFHIVSSIGYYSIGNQPIVKHIGKMPVFVLRNIPLSYQHNAIIKRIVDVLFSSVAITFIFPITLPIVSILIKSSSPGPVFFKQKRTGKQGNEFYCYKFRTMRVSSDANTKQATKDDDRKTKIGDFLRKTSLDELPQLYNVLIGDMSLVGPRPHMLKHTDEYSHKVDKYMVRHFVKPGITGLAQIKGYRGETKDITLMEKRIMADILYVENWTLAMDLKIMLKTVIMIIKGDEHAY